MVNAALTFVFNRVLFNPYSLLSTSPPACWPLGQLSVRCARFSAGSVCLLEEIVLAKSQIYIYTASVPDAEN